MFGIQPIGLIGLLILGVGPVALGLRGLYLAYDRQDDKLEVRSTSLILFGIGMGYLCQPETLVAILLDLLAEIPSVDDAWEPLHLRDRPALESALLE